MKASPKRVEKIIEEKRLCLFCLIDGCFLSVSYCERLFRDRTAPVTSELKSGTAAGKKL